MKRRESLFALTFAASMAIAAFSGCSTPETPSPPAAGSSNASPAAEAKKALTMITSPDYPPYEFYDTSSGSKEIVGFDIDIAKYITKELGYELKIQESDFNGLIPALQAGRADFVMAGMTPTDERKKNVDFTQLYFEATDTIVSLKGKSLKDPKALEGKKVGVQLGSIQEGNLKDISKEVKGITAVPLNKIGELVQELKSKRLDAAIIEDTVAKGYTEANPDLEFNPIAKDPKKPSGSAIAFPKGSAKAAEFDKVITKMKANGELEKLAKQWFEKELPKSK